MKLTLSVIKADIGSIGGHIQPSARLLESVRNSVNEHGSDLIIDSYISFTGDDIAIVIGVLYDDVGDIGFTDPFGCDEVTGIVTGLPRLGRCQM